VNEEFFQKVIKDQRSNEKRLQRLESLETPLGALAGHPPVTLNAGSDPALSIIVQELNLDLSGVQPVLTPGPDIDITVTTIQRKGTDILLFSGAGALLLEYPATLIGLTAAIAAAAAGDVIEIPAGTITGDAVIPAGVTVRGRGWQSVLEGMLTLGVTSGAEHLKVLQDVDTAADIIGIIGPATGEATIRDVQVSLTQAGVGKALGLLSNGGTLRSYECEVWAHGATGSTWGIGAVTGGIVEINQGQVKAWV
jgi:hypothetical protein